MVSPIELIPPPYVLEFSGATLDAYQPLKFKTSHFDFIIWSMKISNGWLGGEFSYKVYSSLDKMAYNMPVHNNRPENLALIKYTPP